MLYNINTFKKIFLTTICKIDKQQISTVWHRELFQYLVVAYNGKESEKEYIYIYILIYNSYIIYIFFFRFFYIVYIKWSHCAVYSKHNIVNQLYFNKKLFVLGEESGLKVNM